MKDNRLIKAAKEDFAALFGREAGTGERNMLLLAIIYAARLLGDSVLDVSNSIQCMEDRAEYRQEIEQS